MQFSNFKEACDHLKNGGHLYTEDKSLIVKKKDSYAIYREGTRFYLKEEDFIELYKDSIFYLSNEKDIYIDMSKDEEYYNFKHK